ncbi:transglutaminase-like domain-containing protein [Actinacidiphila oryziradicis]|uniref:Transglutaminase family protein n=1 Tax=Actinacidiphila oryziradicis TaxID=2571141 RepID=A0A4U0SGZ0_9ACTN|nr:transglutaminase family protein [Actinacidiphila oryziradicis]TKA08772.1 transglutaminase family protein [Actinacidiphila oryziradicis]
MELLQEKSGLEAYLVADHVIDHHHPVVRATAGRLRDQAPGPYDYAEAAFEFVRDTIPHSYDSGDLRVTWRASDVLAGRTGICYAKAHALAALLRAHGIPTGLCYQRLADDDGSDPVVHGLIAMWLPESGRWARQDPRGNKAGVNAQFSLNEERLAWVPRPEYGESDYPILYAAPAPPVLKALLEAVDRPHLSRLLPTAL